MNMFRNISIFAVLLLVNQAIMVAPQTIEESISPASEFDDDFADAPISDEDFSDFASPPELSPEEIAHRKHLENCAVNLTEKCGEEIFSSIFQNGTYTDACCYKLVSMGKECHNGMVNFIVKLPEFKANATVTLPKSEQVWNECVLVASSPSSAPSSSS